MSFKSVFDSVTEMVNEIAGNEKVKCKRCEKETYDTKLVQATYGAVPVCAKCVEEINS